MATFVLCSVFLLAMVAHSDGGYCICKDGLSDGVYQKNIDYACGAGADCSPIQKNGPCFNPNSLRDHCNYAVNSFFQRKGQSSGTCDFSGTATPTQALPSQQNSACFPSSASPAGNSTTTAPTTGTTTPPGSPATGTTTPPTPATGTTPPTSPATGTTTPPTPATGTTTPGTPVTGTSTPGSPATGTSTPGTPATGTTTPSSPASGTATPTTPTTGMTTPTATPATGTTTPTGATTGSPPSSDLGMGPASTTTSTDTSEAHSNMSSFWAFAMTLLFSGPILV